MSFYSTVNTFYDFKTGYGDIFSFNVAELCVEILLEAVFMWIVFEITFFIYRWVLTYKVYSFIVPAESLKAETRLFFVFRNLILGVFINLCFLFPYLSAYITLIEVVATLGILMIYANHLCKVYAEPIVAHFVFKNFCLPVFVYEGLSILISIWAVLV